MMWRRCKRASATATRSDLDRLESRLREEMTTTRSDLIEHIDSMHERASTAGQVRQSRQRTVLAVVAAVVAVVTGLMSWQLLSGSLPTSPTALPPGRIGIATVGDAERDTVQVVARFSAEDPNSTEFELIVTDLGRKAPTEIVLFFCGPIREGLRLSDVNDEGEISFQPMPIRGSSDSNLGHHDACQFAVVKLASEFFRQVILAGRSSHPIRAGSGADVMYSLPGVTTPVVKQDFLGKEAYPLGMGSTIDVSFTDIPDDLRVVHSRPQIPDSGSLAWEQRLSVPGLPGLYRVTGELTTEKARSEVDFFVAGAFVGIFGAAALWLLEILLSIVVERTRDSKSR